MFLIRNFHPVGFLGRAEKIRAANEASIIWKVVQVAA
jgi:hypothetical protein